MAVMTEMFDVSVAETAGSIWYPSLHLQSTTDLLHTVDVMYLFVKVEYSQNALTDDLL